MNTPEDVERFMAMRADVLRRLVDAFGGMDHQGGIVADLIQRERAIMVPRNSKAIDVWVVDGQGRALAYMVNVLQPDRFKTQVCVYSSPREGYLDDPHPLHDGNLIIDLR